MPGLPPGGTAVDGGNDLSILYAAQMAESTLSGAHAAGATTLTLADVAGFRDDMTLGLGVEAHDIVSVDEAVNQVEIAAPGIVAAAYVDGAGVFAAPMFGAADVRPIAGASQYAELDVRFLYDLPQLNGNPPFYNGRSTGAFFAPHASWYESLTNFSYWYAGGNTAAGLPSYSVGLVHATAAFANFWSVDYEIDADRLIFLPADPSLAVAFAPRVRRLVVAGRV